MLRAIMIVMLVFASLLPLSAAIRQDMVFSGNAVSWNDESNSILVRNGKKELSFFIIGKITRDGAKIEMNQLQKNCRVSVFYQKNRNRFVATKIIAISN